MLPVYFVTYLPGPYRSLPKNEPRRGDLFKADAADSFEQAAPTELFVF